MGIPGPSCRPRLLMGEIDAGRPTLAPEVQGLGRAGNHQGTRLKIQQDSGPARPDPPCTGSGARVGGRMASYCWGLNTSSGAGGRERQRQLGTQGGTPQQGPALAHGWARPAGPRAPQQPVAGENPPPGALECGGGSAQPSPPHAPHHSSSPLPRYDTGQQRPRLCPEPPKSSREGANGAESSGVGTSRPPHGAGNPARGRGVAFTFHCTFGGGPTLPHPHPPPVP